MTKIDLSKFKMLVGCPDYQPDSRAITELVMKGVREEEKTYGPVFATRFIKYALELEGEKIGEEPPEDIKTLDQLVEYLVSKTDKYPPYCTVFYAQIKTENDIQGQTGAGTRIEIMSLTKNLVKTRGIEDRDVDVDGAILKFNQVITSIKVNPGYWGYKKNEDGSLDGILPKCYYLDVCKLAFDEDLLIRPNGRMRCGIIAFLCQYLSLVTGYDWDYDILDFHAPYCIARFFML